MINDIAFRVKTACPDAGIATFMKHACLVSLTIGINDAFRSTTDIWISEVFGDTCADSVVASSILAAW